MEKILSEYIIYYFRQLQLTKISSLVLLLVSAFITSCITEYISSFKLNTNGFNRDWIPYFNLSQISLVIWLIIFLLLKAIWDRLVQVLLNQISKFQPKFLFIFDQDFSNFSKKWYVQGFPVLKNEGLFLTNSNSGCLIKPGIPLSLKKWKNFKAIVKVEFVVEKNHNFKQIFAFLFRAQSLDDHFMIETWKKEDKLLMRPHVRISGDWEAPYLDPDESFFSIGSFRSEFTIEFILEDQILKVIYNSEEKFVWNLPSHYIISVSKQQSQPSLQDGIIRKINFSQKVGMIGLRNYGDEIALIKSIEIDAL